STGPARAPAHRTTRASVSRARTSTFPRRNAARAAARGTARYLPAALPARRRPRARLSHRSRTGAREPEVGAASPGHRDATVGALDLTGDERGRVGHEVEERARDVLRLARATEWRERT